MKKFKIVAIVLALLMVAAAFAACAKPVDNSEELSALRNQLSAAHAQLAAANLKINELQEQLKEPDEFDPTQFTSWLLESNNWLSIQRGYVSQDPKDKIPYDVLVECLTLAQKMQQAGGYANIYFVAVYDEAAQREILAKSNSQFTSGVAAVSPATVFVYMFVYTGGLSGANTSAGWRNFDCGMTAGLFATALWAHGYLTHFLADSGWLSTGRTYDDVIKDILKNHGYWFTNQAGAHPNVVGSAAASVDMLNWTFLHGLLFGKPDLTKARGSFAAGTIDAYTTVRGRNLNFGIWA